MTIDMQTGLYGKLPAHGDFVHRNLSNSFIKLWDDWLQLFVSGSRDQLGDDWLDIYLTSPIWRFSLSSGVMDEFNWNGIVMPSVDRVGRYFPLTIVRPVSANASPVSLIVQAQTWFEQVEAHCLDALEHTIEVDALLDSIMQINLEVQSKYQPTGHFGEGWPQVFGLGGGTGEALNALMPNWLSATLSAGMPSFSIWHTTGSERVGPVLFCCQGLPPIGGIASMLDGHWQQRNWKIPYNLQQTVAD